MTFSVHTAATAARMTPPAPIRPASAIRIREVTAALRRNNFGEVYMEMLHPPIERNEDFLKYNPGSPGAVERGCTCPQAENNFGRGRSKNSVVEPSFTADPRCTIHGFEALRIAKFQGDRRNPMDIHGITATNTNPTTSAVMYPTIGRIASSGLTRPTAQAT
jgi:hypothetical protein